MALDRGSISNVVRVSAASTVAIATCSSSKKVYIKSIVLHAAGTGIGTATGQVYVVPNGNSVADVTDGSYDHIIFNVDVKSGETVLLEPTYPIVLDTTGDKLFVGTGNYSGVAATHMNFYITGDQEV